MRVRPFRVVHALALALTACSESHSGRAERDADAMAAAAAMTCADLGGMCGSSPDLPCDSRARWVGLACPDLRPCCVPLPLPPAGACWGSEDCVAAPSPAGRPVAVASCEPAAAQPDAGAGRWQPGSCACTAYGVRMDDGRCGPALRAGERFLCSIDHAFRGNPGSCDGTPCAPASTCMEIGSGAADCRAPWQPMLGTFRPMPDPREWCEVVDCGDIRCEAPLRCTDLERGTCEP